MLRLTKLAESYYSHGYKLLQQKERDQNHPREEAYKAVSRRHTMEYDLTLKDKEAQLHAATRMGLENMILGERSKSQKITNGLSLCI